MRKMHGVNGWPMVGGAYRMRRYEFSLAGAGVIVGGTGGCMVCCSN